MKHITLSDGSIMTIPDSTDINQKIVVSLPNKKYVSTLVDSLEEKNDIVFNALLELKPEQSDLNRALAIAAINGDLAKISLLLLAGAEVNADFDEGYDTPLGHAINDNNLELVKFLLDKGAKVSDHALVNAAIDGNIGIGKLLLGAGAPLNGRSVSGDSSLHEAIRENHLEFATWLIEQKADINAVNDVNETPLHLAIFYKHWEFALNLIKLGADTTIANVENMSPLDYIDKENQHYKFILARHIPNKDKAIVFPFWNKEVIEAIESVDSHNVPQQNK
jgi:ankyrin repeat protein